MRAARSFVIVVALVAWIYSWWLFRGVRAEYTTGEVGSMPGWLLVLLGGTTTALVATAVAAWLRAPAWPLLALAGSVGLVASVVGSQYGVMKSAVDALAPGTPLALTDAVRALVRTRGSFEIALISGLSMFLLLGGVTAYLRPIRQAVEQG